MSERTRKKSQPSRARSRLPAALAAAAAALAGLVLAAPSARPASTPEKGLYAGASNPSGVVAFERWAGFRVTRALDFLPRTSWKRIARPTWSTRSWGRSRYRVTYSVPMIPDSGGTLAAGAAGSYNRHFAQLARTLIAAKQANAVLRLGWEFNGGWYPWTARNGPSAFVAYWRRIVKTMRRVPGARFRFDWSPALGPGAIPAERAYPGDAYVDYIGLDVYDQGWYEGWRDPARRWQSLMDQPYGLAWHRNFAAAHRKPMTFPEWGLSLRSDGHGGGDAPYFVDRMHDWIQRNDVAYHLYFNVDNSDGQHRLDHFPRAAARYRELF